jgi:hypothetical protein
MSGSKLWRNSSEDLGSPQWYLRDRLDPCCTKGLPLKVDNMVFTTSRGGRIELGLESERKSFICMWQSLLFWWLYIMGYQEDCAHHSYLWGRFAPALKGGNPWVLSDSPDWPQGCMILYV